MISEYINMTNNIKTTQNTCELNVEVYFVKEDEYTTAYCPALEVSGYGLTEEEARESFDVALKIFLEETNKRGTFEKYLLAHGWTLQQQPEFIYTPPKETGLASAIKESSHRKMSIPVFC
jgi:hypothetical protein